MSQAIAATLEFLKSNGSFSAVIKENVDLDESSSKRLVKKLEQDGITAKIYKDTEWEEFIVRFYDVSGKEFTDADYHTDDIEDALSTAKAQMNQLSRVEEVDDMAEAAEKTTYSAYDKGGDAVQEMVPLNATTQEEAVAEAKSLGKERGWKIVGVKASKWSSELDESGVKGGRSYSVTGRTKDGKIRSGKDGYPHKEVVSGSFSFGAYDAAKQFAEKHLQGYEVIPGGTTYNGGRKFEAVNHDAGYGADIYVEEADDLDEGIGDFVTGIKGGMKGLGNGIKGAYDHVKNSYANGRDQEVINKNQAKVDALKAKMSQRNSAPASQQEPSMGQNAPEQAASAPQSSKAASAPNQSNAKRDAQDAGFNSVGEWYNDMNKRAMSDDPRVAQQGQRDLQKYEQMYGPQARDSQQKQPAPTPQAAIAQADAVKLLNSLSKGGKLEIKVASQIVALATKLMAAGIK